MDMKCIVLIFVLGCSYVESRPGIGGYHGINTLAIKQQGGIPPISHVDIQQVPAAYDFSWGVKDSHYGNDFGHQESRDGYDTTGSYYVLLPDGRLQNVKYFVNGKSGFVADVSYDGEAIYPAHSHLEPVIAKSDQFHHVRPYQTLASKSEQFHNVQPFKGSASTQEETIVKNFNIQPKHNAEPVEDESFKQHSDHDSFQPTSNYHSFQKPVISYSNPIAKSAEVDEVQQSLEGIDYSESFELGRQMPYQNRYTK